MMFFHKKARNPPPPVTSPAANRPKLAGAPAAAKLPIDDTRIRDIMELAPPTHLLREFPASDVAARTT